MTKFATGLFDKNNIEIFIGDMYTTIASKHIYTVFFIYGAVCGGINEETAIPLGWCPSSSDCDGIKPNGSRLNWLELITTNEA